ncbi:hypothetical protein SLEP1_g9661 [Rubroshorea leprosula]|uniref:Uncharacterized protein n=1 Tax=Rubroshorea leprosula TaxID=152421 RepID=A0AAV5IEZ9_9ROSI|nr:hypothetical protein SLEP1_g9661 [Rubroshorea leprosula]
MYSRYKDGTLTADHVNDFLGIIKELANLGIEFNDEVNGLILLNTLPESWESFRSTTINSSLGGIVTLEIAKNRIFEEEKRMQALGIFSQPDTQAVVMENRGRSKTKEPGGRGGRSRSKSKSRVKCYHCGQSGHMKRNCNLLKGKAKKKVEDSNTIAVASTSGGDVTLLCDHEECCHVENSDAEWIIDSGASYHYVPKREYFSTYKAGDFGTIKMGNKSVSHIMGVALDEEGYAHYFGNGSWKLTKGSMVVAKGSACCSLYKTHMKTCGGQLNIVEDEASPILWHKRLAHMSEKGLQRFAKETRLKLKCFHTDNGREYASKEFRDYYLKHCIRHEKTVPSTPQHNDVAERMNHTIVEKVRCMLRMAILPKPLWGEAVNTTVYLINRSPSVPLNFEISEKEQRTKLDDKAIPFIFIGYGDEEFDYRLWDLEKEKTVRSRDVMFHEHEKINDLKEEKAPRSSGEGVEDLTLAKTPSRRITNREEGEPENFKEILSHKDKDCWMKAIQEEMNSLHKSNTFELMELPKGRKTLKNKWVFKLKKDGDKIVRYKAQLVVKGFSKKKKKGIDFDEIFSPVVKMSSIRVVLDLVASMNLELEQLDVKTAFLHGYLHEEIYMDQLEGFKEEEKEHMVCKLRKSLYGLKQAPRQWYKKFDSFMMSHGYKRINANPCVYIRSFRDGNFIILLLYVDDMLILGQDVEKFCRLKKKLSKSFDMKDLGPTKQILVSTPLANHFKLSKRSWLSTKEEKEKMSSIPYSSVVGSLMYAMVCTWLDIAHAVGVRSRFLSNPGKIH